MSERPKITLYDRITIAVQALVPVVRTLRQELGEARADDLVRAALRESDLAQGQAVAAKGTPNGATMTKGLEAYAEGGALDYELLRADDQGFDFDVRRCRYMEFMTEIGARELGPLLICERDFAVAEGMGVALERRQTLMQGAPCCDFRHRLTPER